MTQKRTKSITERINDLVYKLDAVPPPEPHFIKGRLSQISELVEALEQGKVIREAEAKIAVLEKQKRKFKAENENLKVELQAAKTEIQRFRAEQKEREKKDKDIPDIQFKILKDLPTEHMGDGATLKGVSRRAKIRPDDAEVHLARLVKAGLADFRQHHLTGGVFTAWYRTIPGSELVLAKRLASEEQEEEEEYTQPQPDLLQGERIVLSIVAEGDGMTPEQIVERYNKALPVIGKTIGTAAMILLFLIRLRDRKMVSDVGGKQWKARRRGIAYLAERDML